MDEDEVDDVGVDDRCREGSIERLDETWLPITATRYLYLSGTPFRAINSGEFIEDQIYNWTYSDGQRAKVEWDGAPRTSPPTNDIGNPYAALPRMVMLTYKIPDSIQRIWLWSFYHRHIDARINMHETLGVHEKKAKRPLYTYT